MGEQSDRPRGVPAAAAQPRRWPAAPGSALSLSVPCPRSLGGTAGVCAEGSAVRICPDPRLQLKAAEGSCSYIR